MTLPDNEALAKLAADATPGPWHMGGDGEGGLFIGGDGRVLANTIGSVLTRRPNAELIALAPSLAAEVIALRKRVEAADAMAEALAWYQDKAHWCNNFTSAGDNARNDLATDRGSNAEAAIIAYRATGAA